MTYIPNVRKRVIEPLFKGTKGDNGPKENAYWEGYLDGNGKLEVAGYDLCVENVRNYFDNLLGFSDIEDADDVIELRDDLLDWLEAERNDLVVSIIENMDEKVYEHIVAMRKEMDS